METRRKLILNMLTVEISMAHNEERELEKSDTHRKG